LKPIGYGDKGIENVVVVITVSSSTLITAIGIDVNDHSDSTATRTAFLITPLLSFVVDESGG
jgi:hypothetical protein